MLSTVGPGGPSEPSLINDRNDLEQASVRDLLQEAVDDGVKGDAGRRRVDLVAIVVCHLQRVELADEPASQLLGHEDAHLVRHRPLMPSDDP